MSHGRSKSASPLNLKGGQGVLIGDHGRQTNIFELFAEGTTPSIGEQIRVREFQSLIEERTRNFVGRALVIKAIQEAFGDPEFPSGYVVLRGEPGIGKTALLGELVKRWNCVHHFNIAAQNIRTTRDFLSNTCAQLIRRYGLDYSRLPAKATRDSGFLSELLIEIHKKEKNDPVPIVVDALDESDDTDIGTGANRLCLPGVLPDRVYFIVSAREEFDPHLVVDRSRTLYLREGDPENKCDVKKYIERFIEKHGGLLQQRIAEWKVSAARFIEVISEKSQGNFMYLTYVLADILAGKITRSSIDQVDKLPAGLRAYYERHWRLMKKADPVRFEQSYEPVLCQLAVVREPVTIQQLQEWTRLPGPKIRVVLRDWRQFLNEDDAANGGSKYRLYHASFQDFLREEVGLTTFHDNIVRTSLNKIANFLRGN